MQSAKKEEHIYRDDDDDVFSNRIGNRIVARRLQKNRMRFHPPPPFRSKRKAAFFLPDEFSQKDLFVRVERLLFGKREREREGRVSASIEDKKTLVVVIKNRSHKKSAENNNERSTLQKTRWLTLMISDNSWLISAWNANVSVSSSPAMMIVVL